MLKDDILIVENKKSGVTWRIFHEHIAAEAFRSNIRRARQRYLFIKSKHHKSDADQVAIQLLVVTATEIYMRTQAVYTNICMCIMYVYVYNVSLCFCILKSYICIFIYLFKSLYFIILGHFKW